MDTNKPAALALIKLELRSVDFWGGRKTGEPTTNSTHMRRQGRESNLGHRGGWQVALLIHCTTHTPLIEIILDE